MTMQGKHEWRTTHRDDPGWCIYCHEDYSDGGRDALCPASDHGISESQIEEAMQQEELRKDREVDNGR